MRIHISDAMIDASFTAMKAEAIKDGVGWEDSIRANPNQEKRFREVVRSMIQAAADVASTNPKETT